MKLKNHGRFRPSCVAPSAEMNSRTRWRDPLIRSGNFCATQLRLVSSGIEEDILSRENLPRLFTLKLTSTMARFEISSLSRVPFVTRSFHCISPTHASRRSSFPPSFHPSFEIRPYPPLSFSFSLVCPIRVTGRDSSMANRILAISSSLTIIILVHEKLSRCTSVSTPWRLGNTWLQTICPYTREKIE